MVDTLPQALMAASAAIMLILGALHLLFTFHGTKLHPRDASLIEQLRAVSPVITNQTTMWKTWIGFNASHSLGAMMFGAVYGYLALMEPTLLFDSIYLGSVGFVVLVAYASLGHLYWFSTPFRGILAALACYIVAYAIRVA